MSPLNLAAGMLLVAFFVGIFCGWVLKSIAILIKESGQ